LVARRKEKGVSFDMVLVARAGLGGYLVRRRIFAEADVAVDAKVDVLEGKLGDGGVEGDDGVGEGRDVGFPVLEGAAVLGVVGWVHRLVQSGTVMGWRRGGPTFEPRPLVVRLEVLEKGERVGVEAVVGVGDAARLAQLGEGDEGHFWRGVLVNFLIAVFRVVVYICFVLVVVFVVITLGLGFDLGLLGRPPPAASFFWRALIPVDFGF